MNMHCVKYLQQSHSDKIKFETKMMSFAQALVILLFEQGFDAIRRRSLCKATTKLARKIQS
jgi:hypothetical protein